jgi:hypothetical protein
MMGQKKVEIFSIKFRKSLAKQFLEVAISIKGCNNFATLLQLYYTSYEIYY